MRLIKKFGLIFICLAMLLLSLSAVSAAEVIVTGNNNTDQIQSIITGTNNDIVFQGAFNNLSTLNITRSIKISGDNAVITRNNSTNNNLTLFNITAQNVIIENLVIKGYNATIVSNSGDILLQNNHITSSFTAINITSSRDLNNVQIKNNYLSTSRTTGDAIFLSSSSGSVYNNIISGNTIKTEVGNSAGVNMSSNTGNLYNNVISDNVITTTSTGSGSHGIYLRTNTGKLINNIVYRNNITTRSAHGVYIFVATGTLENNNINFNNIKFTVSTQTNSSGIFMNAQPGNMSNNNVSNNNIEGFLNHATGGVRGIDLHVNSANHIMIGNTISNNNITLSNITLDYNYAHSYGILVYAWCAYGNDTAIYGNNIVVNCTAIRVGASSGTINNLNISYNRILTNGMFITLDKTGAGSIGVNNTASANWFGNNSPAMNKFIAIDVLSYYVVTATALKNTGLVGENWIINYGFYLNNSDDRGDFDKLPFFLAKLEEVGILVDERIAYETGMWNIAIENPTIRDFYIVLDYETILFNGFSSDKGQSNITADIEGKLEANKTVTINVVLKNSEGNPLANQLVTLIIDGKEIESKFTDTDGKVSFEYVFEANGQYNILVSFDGDENYEGSNHALDITVPTDTGNGNDDNGSQDPSKPDDGNSVDDKSKKPEDPANPKYPENETSDNEDESGFLGVSREMNNVNANISMKETGIPILVLLLLAILIPSFIVRKRK